MLRHIKTAVVCIFSVMIFSGCEAEKNDACTTSEVKGNTNSQEFSSETEGETIPPELKMVIDVEAGTKEITLEDVIMGYRHQDAEFVNNITEEELMVSNAVYTLDLSYKGKDYTVKVNVKDTTPPVIMGVQDMYIYEGDSVAYKKNITVEDNSSDEIQLLVDNSKVNINKAGEYPVYYSATDLSGNTTEVQAKIYVEPQPVIDEEYITPLADQIIKAVITDDMSDWDKAYALWKWCREHISYTHTSGDRTSVWTGAYEGLKKRCGDCYAYYATYAVLLDRVGIENMQVSRVGGTSNHWWNLVNVGDGWYHCDASPRTEGDKYKCFMQTDEQIGNYTEMYTEKHPEKPNYYTFDESLYPERAVKIVFGD